MGPALLTGAMVAAGCGLAAWGNALRLEVRVSNEHCQRIVRRQLAGSGLGGFMGGTATGLSLVAAGFDRPSDFAMLGCMFAVIGALGVTVFLNTRKATEVHFQEAFLGALAFSGPWLVFFLWIVCQ